MNSNVFSKIRKSSGEKNEIVVFFVTDGFQTIGNEILTDDMHVKQCHGRYCMKTITKMCERTTSIIFRCCSTKQSRISLLEIRSFMLTHFSATSLPIFSMCFRRGRWVLLIDFRSAINSFGITNKWIRAYNEHDCRENDEWKIAERTFGNLSWMTVHRSSRCNRTLSSSNAVDNPADQWFFFVGFPLECCSADALRFSGVDGNADAIVDNISK